MAIKRRDIDRIYNAIRPRLNPQARTGAAVAGVLPAHTHSADQITSEVAGDVAATNVQDAIAEIASEKLARDGSQTVTGNLDHDHHSINNVDDADIEGTATVGEDVVLTEGVGGAKITNPRVVTLAGAEGDGEGRIEEINALAFNSVATTEEVGRAGWDSTEDTLVVFVESGAVLLLVALGWAVKLAANGAA